MSVRGIGIPATSTGFATLFLAAIVLLAPPAVLAQRGGGRGGASGAGRRPVICIYDCREPNSSTSDEDDARVARVMAVQANSDQTAAFATISKATVDSVTQLQALRDALQKTVPAKQLVDQGSRLEDLLKKARAGNQNFVAALTPQQQSGLKEATRKLAKADADLDKEIKSFDRVLDPKPDPSKLAAAATSLDKAVSIFQTEQLALGAEMSVLLPTGKHEIAYTLEPVTSSVEVGGESISVPAAGAIAQGLPADGPDTYSVRFVADLSDLQDGMTVVLRGVLNQAMRCGLRVEIQEATLVPQPPAALVDIHLHFERWICPPGMGAATELANMDGSIELKLTPSIDEKGGLHLTSQTGRVDAQGLLRDALLTGDLGETFREQVPAAVLVTLQKAVDVRDSLPAPVQSSALLQKARFRDAGTEHLGFVLDGQLKLGSDPTKEFAAQLKQRLTAQETASQ